MRNQKRGGGLHKFLGRFLFQYSMIPFHEKVEDEKKEYFVFSIQFIFTFIQFWKAYMINFKINCLLKNS